MIIAEQKLLQTRTHRIERVYKETGDTFTIQLDAGPEGFHFAPGQFNMLYIFGIGEMPISISGDPSESDRIVHTTRAVGTTTRALQRKRRGDLIGVRGPFGSHWPVEESEGADVLIIAGGIGLPPLRPAILQIIRNRGEYAKFAIIYGARTPSEILYRPMLEKWRGRFDVQVEVTVDTARPDWLGQVGLVTTLISRATFDPDHTVAMVCGPEIMIRVVVRDLQKAGVNPESIYISMERNMQCGIGLCGRCQIGPKFACKDGPVFRYSEIKPFFDARGM